MTSENPFPLVSAIMPLYQQQEHIKHAIESVAAQTYPALEIIVIDDCSTDDSYTDAARMTADDDRFTVLCHKKRSGLWTTRRNGVMKATGKYVIFVDPRETLEPNAIEMLVEAMIENHTDLVQMRRHIRNARNFGFFAENAYTPFGEIVSGEEFRTLCSTLGQGTIISPFCGDKLYRRDMLREAFGVDFSDAWGDVQVMNIQYLRHARSIYFLDYYGVYANWQDDATNYKVSRLHDYKNLFCLKQIMGQNADFIHEELTNSLHYYVSQLLGELAWTREAVEFFVDKELSDPFWKNNGIEISAHELIEMHSPQQSRNPLKIILKSIMRK